MRISIVPAVLVLALAAGCDGTSTPGLPTAPSFQGQKEPPEREFYPLSVGNRWTYDRKFTIDIEVIFGPPYHWAETYEATVERRIIGPEEISGVGYLVEQSMLTVPDKPDVMTRWTRFRQDHAGLYVADVSTTDPPDPVPPADSIDRSHPWGASAERLGFPMFRGEESAGPASGFLPTRGDREVFPGAIPAFAERAWRKHAERLDTLCRLIEPGFTYPEAPSGRPGGLLTGELLYLVYPLHPKSTWFNREEPFVVRSEVETHEVLDLPAGRFPSYRLRVDNEFLEPEDRVLMWYASCGRIAFSIHTETLALDVETGEIARITTDETERLRDLALVDPRGCGRGSAGGGR